MIGRAGQWTQTPSTTPLQPKKMKCLFLDYVHFWWSAWLIDELEPHLPPSSAKKMKCSFLDYIQLLMIGRAGWGLPPLFSQKMKCSFLDYIQLLMIGQAGQWTQTPSATPLQPKKWNAHFWITFTLDDWPGWSMDSNPIHHPSPANKMKCFFLDYVHYWWSARLVNGLEPHLPPLSTQKSEMIIFGLHSTSDDWPGWLMDSNPIHHNSSVKKWNAHFLDYVQLLMISQAGQWTRTPSATPLQPKKWNAHFWIMFNFRLLACRSMDSNPICQPSPTNKMKCSFLEYVQLLMISLAGLWTQTPSASPLQPKKWNATFWITFNFWWLAGLVNGLKPHPPPLSSQRNERLIFLLCSTSNDQPGLSMDLNPIHNLSPAKKWNAHFWIMFNFWWLAELLDWLEPHPPPLSTQKHEMLVFV